MSKIEFLLSASPHVRPAIEHLTHKRFKEGLEEWRKAMTDRGFCYENCEQRGKSMDNKACSVCCEALLLTLTLYCGKSSENEYVELIEQLRDWVSGSNEEAA